MRALFEFIRPASALVFKEDNLSDYKNVNTLGVRPRKRANRDVNSK